LALAEAALSLGVRDFVFASTIGVHGTSTEGRPPFREADAFNPKSVYAETKVAAEQGLEQIASRSRMACTVIRPPLVYGRGAPGNFDILARAVRKGVPLPLASVQNRRAFLSVHNLVDFIQLRLQQRNTGIEAYILADAEQVSTKQFIRGLGDALGYPPRFFPFPPKLLAAALRVAGREAVSDGLLSSLEVDTQRARSTGWNPPIDLREGLKRAVAD
jgi:UDP-glucose 4-epimerase